MPPSGLVNAHAEGANEPKNIATLKTKKSPGRSSSRWSEHHRFSYLMKKQRAIVPQQPQQIYPRPPELISPQSQEAAPIIQHRTSHYIPFIVRTGQADNGLCEVAKVFVFGGFIVIGFTMLSLSVIHLGNAVYWQGERMHQRVQPGYLGGPWNE